MQKVKKGRSLRPLRPLRALDSSVVYADPCTRDYTRITADGEGRGEGRGYVASARNGVSYRGRWTHIDGFSEAVLKYIAEMERQ
jgi:hypothetical protein